VTSCSSALVAAANAQEPPRRLPSRSFPSGPTVRIDVVVTDKGGRPKQGLTKADFQVLEEAYPSP
jgi:hypothetical protein